MNIFFPEVAGTSLAGEDFEFPKSLGADLTLAIIAFWDWQQSAADTWVRASKRLERQAPGFEYFETPVIQRSTPNAQRFIDEGMRSAIGNRIAREKTITLYVDKPEFMRSIGLPSDDEIYAVLLDSSGLILRIWTGPATSQSRRQLEDLAWALEPAR